MRFPRPPVVALRHPFIISPQIMMISPSLTSVRRARAGTLVQWEFLQERMIGQTMASSY